MDGVQDALSALAPMLRVRPELQDFCRFGGDWCAVHDPEERGWAAFHVVTKGGCVVERTGQPAVELGEGDVLLLPHGDGHVVYGGAGRTAFRQIAYTFRDYIRLKQTEGGHADTELICGRLHLENTSGTLALRSLPGAIVLKLAGAEACRNIVAVVRDELTHDPPGASAVTRDLASALFVLLLRRYLETDPPVAGLLALLTTRETGRAVAAMLHEPARDWGLDELAALALVSRATLVRAFRRISGLPPQALLTEIRLGMARSRISGSGEPLSAIAAEVGYQSDAALSRALHRRFGVRPGAMRQRDERVVKIGYGGGAIPADTAESETAGPPSDGIVS